MRLLNVYQAQVARIVRSIGNYGYVPDTVKAVVDRYNFVKYPQGADLIMDVISPKPLTFSQGKVVIDDRVIVVEKMEIYQGGLLVTTRSNTTDSILVLDNALGWASERFGIKYEEIFPAPMYFSQLEIGLELPLPQCFPQVSTIGSAISKRLSKFWEKPPRFEMTGFTFYFDKFKYPAHSPVPFKLERRAENPFEKEVYWTEAPLSTDDHVAVLTEFEQACLI
ncbi:MAG: hypothetical protein Q7S58_07110 [Candidatus Binatus sp.]|uniref:hypothetical protein n=1 Tax=Candidatus Binatus sp. TaxID=2811406 RepID=UPI00271E3B02|nr:hypothetical protein [Candidatus Binatus sp.]MDO8432166.1 hypothetical protein [Candidatus Binatus sp.]